MCKVATVRNVARRKGWEIGNVDAHLEQVVKREKGGKLTTTVTSAITIEGDITEEQAEQILSGEGRGQRGEGRGQRGNGGNGGPRGGGNN